MPLLLFLKNKNFGGTAVNKITVKIDGMACTMCESHINDCVRNRFKVKSVKSSHTKGECNIITENEIDENELKSQIEETGYKVISIEKQEYKKKGLFGK